MNSFSQHDFFLLSTLSHQTERYPDLLFFLTRFLETPSELSIDERTLVSTAYKNVVGNKRAELRVLQAIEQKELRKGHEGNIGFIKNYREKIEKELRDICEEVITCLDTKLIPNNKSSIDSKIFFLKMKGDYFRYQAEFLLEQEYNNAVDAAADAYKEADQLARNNLASTNPIRLGLQLNMAVFFYEILGKIEEGRRIATTAFDEAIGNIDNVNQEDYKDCTLIMQLLRDNLTLWGGETGMEEGGEDNS